MQKHIETLLSLWRKNGKSNQLSKDEVKKLGAALLKLQRGLTGDRNLAGKNYMQDPFLFGAYLLYYWPVSYIQVEKVIEQVKFPHQKCFNILECGSGPAPGTCAILDKIFAENPDAKVDVLLLDSSSQALSTAEKIIKKDYKNVSVRTKVSNLEKIKIPSEYFDFILLSHVLNELWKNESDKIERRFQLLEKLEEHLSEDDPFSSGGILILNEPSILEASRNLILLRDRLLQSGMKLLAPCPASDCKKCPVLETENHTCHGEYFINGIKLLDDLSREAGLKRVSVKMSFFVFQKNLYHKKSEAASTIGAPGTAGEASEGECRMTGVNSSTPDKQTSQDFKRERVLTVCKGGKRGPEGETPNILKGKIVSEGMLNKSGRVRFLVCDGEKRIPLSAKQDDKTAAAQGFFKLKRYDDVEIENPEVRENGFGMSGAVLRVKR